MDQILLKNFILISKYAGMREDLIQAGGGNSSVKLDEETMLVKASGYQLADITEHSGYATVNYKLITEKFRTTSVEKMTEEYGSEIISNAYLKGDRPSIETFLHAITNTYTLHTHPTVVNVLTSRIGGMSILQKLFPSALFVGYQTPGILLANAYFHAYQEKTSAGVINENIVFLKNHGLIVSAKTGMEVIKLTNHIIEKISAYLEYDTAPYQNVTELYLSLKNYMDDEIVYLSQDNRIQKAIAQFGSKMWTYQFCPDCIVYCGKIPLVFSDTIDESELKKYIDTTGIPAIIYLQKRIYILAANIKKAKEIESVLSFSAEIALLNKSYSMDLLEEKEQNHLLHWEAEKYRKNQK